MVESKTVCDVVFWSWGTSAVKRRWQIYLFWALHLKKAAWVRWLWSHFSGMPHLSVKKWTRNLNISLIICLFPSFLHIKSRLIFWINDWGYCNFWHHIWVCFACVYLYIFSLQNITYKITFTPLQEWSWCQNDSNIHTSCFDCVFFHLGSVMFLQIEKLVVLGQVWMPWDKKYNQ